MPKERVHGVCLLAAAAVSGGVVMAVELLGARILSVAYGCTLSVWAAMISVTLLSLAAGYFLGGWLADRYPRSWLLGVILLASGALLMVCPHTGFVIRGCYRAVGLKGGALASSAVIFFLPLGMMGMVSPFVIRILCTGRGDERVGVTAGGVYALSTVGSVVGTLLTGLWLIPTFGTTTGFRIAAVAQAAAGAALLVSDLGPRLTVVLVIPVALAFVPAPSSRVGQEHVAPDGEGVTLVAVRESAHGHITVLRKGDYTLLLVNGIVQTGVPSHLRRGRGLEDRYFQELLPYMVDDPRRAAALVVGLAGGMTSSMLMMYEMDVDSVDVDPEIVQVAREHCGFTGRATIADGRRFLEDCTRKYDFCVIDTYSGDVFPFHLATREAFVAARKVLKPGGVLTVNYIGSPTGKAFACFHLTLREVFDHILAIRAEEGDDVQTITVFASDRPMTFNKRWKDLSLDFAGSRGPDTVTADIRRLTVAPPASADAFVLTDDYSPIDFLRADEALRWRERTAEAIGEIGGF